MKDSRDFPDGEKNPPLPGKMPDQGPTWPGAAAFRPGPRASGGGIYRFASTMTGPCMRRYKKASRACGRCFGRQGIITADEAASLIGGLGPAVLEEIRQGKFEWKQSLEDVHMNIEKAG